MLCPKKIKYRKIQKGKIRGVETRVNNPTIGVYGIKSLTSGRITAQQIVLFAPPDHHLVLVNKQF